MESARHFDGHHPAGSDGASLDGRLGPGHCDDHGHHAALSAVFHLADNHCHMAQRHSRSMQRQGQKAESFFSSFHHLTIPFNLIIECLP